jgi:hypothetical protein
MGVSPSPKNLPLSCEERGNEGVRERKMANEKEKIEFENAIEIVLKAYPDAVLPIIHTIASELTYDEGHYSFRDMHSSADVNASISRCAIAVINNVKKDNGFIGIITIQPFPDNHTLFRIPPYSKWEIGECKLDPDGKLFTYYVRQLFIEFQRMGFIDFKEEKPPLGFKPRRKGA